MSSLEQDPTIVVEINGQPLELMADSGAAFTCIRPEDATHLPMSDQLIRTVGFEGIKQLVPLTKPVELCYKNQKAVIPVLVSAHTPIALLGRDALCRLNCVIKCTPDGCQVDMPSDAASQLVMTPAVESSVVFWIGDLSSELLRPAELWEKFIMAQIPDSRCPDYPFHCTLQYFKDVARLDPGNWLSQQPKQVGLRACCIILGPQGAAMKMDMDEYLRKEYKIERSAPHVTLRVSEHYEQKHIGDMMMEAQKASFEPVDGTLTIWRSKDRRFIKIMILAEGHGRPQVVRMTHESICSNNLDVDDMKEEMLRQVPQHLWSRHSTDIGLVKSASPVKVDLRPGTKPPWKNQYPVAEEAVRGIESQIVGLLKAGVLKTTRHPQSNTPLLPTKKPDETYRMVHDLRAVNEVVADFTADVPDPHTLLAQIPPEATHFTVVDLCGAFFSVPLAEESQGLFGFTYKGQHYVYTRLPQGFKHSPHLFNKVLKDDLAGIDQELQSTVIQYVDDIIVCSPDKDTCHKDSIRLLQMLADKGHKASQKKLQYCQEEVTYLGQSITQGHRSISDSHLTAIRKAPKPRTVREMLTFLGISGYSSAWIEDYANIIGPLRVMIKDTGSPYLHCNLVWTQEGRVAFETIKQRLQEAPALALPDYSRNFLLYVSMSAGGKFACAVLCQPTGTGTKPQPVAYYSTAYSEVELGLPVCYRAMVGVFLMYDKASSITMGYPVTILTHHSLRNLLNYGKYVLTMPRLRDYHRLLEQEDVTLVRCVTVNPAEHLPTSEDGEPHDCVQEAERYAKLRADLQALPLCEADLEYWTDGSCYRVGNTLSAGYAIVEAQGTEFVVVKAETIPQPASAQLAELVGLTEACLLAEGKRVTIYTDSAYAHNVCHLFGAVWKNRGFKKTDGSLIQHQAQIMKLLQAMMKPKEIAIAKCVAHKPDASRIARGNKAADEAAKAATGANKLGEVFLVTHEIDLEDKITLKDVLAMQDAVPNVEKQLWRERGATQDSEGLWRNHEGLLVAPPDLLGLMIQEAHGLAHVARGEVKRKIIKDYGFWAPYLLEQIDYHIGRCTICLKNNVRRGVAVPPGHIPTPRGPMRELVMDFVDMLKPVGGKRYMLVVVDRFSRWPEACPTKRKDAQSVANFLCREVVSRWGLPDRISSDNGKEFVDKTVKLILQKLGIKQRLGAVYHPQSQGMCEKMNGILKNRIVKICQHTGLNWIEALPLALMVCRSSELRDLHLTPYELMMGRQMPTPCLRTSGKGPSMALLEDDMRAYVNYLAVLHKKISTYVSDRQRREEAQERLDEQKRSTVQPGDRVFVKVFRRKWYNERREGPFEVVRSTGTAVQVKGSPTWYHLSHCVKAPKEGVPPSDNQDESSSEQGDVLSTLEDVDAPVHIANDTSGDPAADEEERRFEDIDLQHVPDTAGCIPEEITERGNAVPDPPEPTGQRSPRPVRRRVKPQRYGNYC